MSASINNSSQYIPLLKLASKLLKGSDKRLLVLLKNEWVMLYIDDSIS